MGKHREDSGRFLGRQRVQSPDLPVADSTRNQNAVADIGNLRLGRVPRSSRDLEQSIYPVKRLADKVFSRGGHDPVL